LSAYDHFPKIIQYKIGSEGYLITEYVGEPLDHSNIPENINQQIEKICEALMNEKIEHRDIKPNELLVKNGIIYLVDFGFSLINGKFIPDQTPINNSFEDRIAIEGIINNILDKKRKYIIPKIINKKL
jgi:serine/threonine protein kinase